MTVYGKPGKRPEPRRNTDRTLRAFPSLSTDLGNRKDDFHIPSASTTANLIKFKTERTFRSSPYLRSLQAHSSIGKDLSCTRARGGIQLAFPMASRMWLCRAGRFGSPVRAEEISANFDTGPNPCFLFHPACIKEVPTHVSWNQYFALIHADFSRFLFPCKATHECVSA